MKIITEVKTTIIPNRVIFNGNVKKILKVDEKFNITEYKILLTSDNKLIKLILNNPHPNCNPKNGEFCLSFNLVGKVVDRTTLPVIESLLKTFNLDDCYFQPWREIYFE